MVMVSEKFPPSRGVMVTTGAVSDWPAANPEKAPSPLTVTSCVPLALKSPESRSDRPAAVLTTPRFTLSGPDTAPRSRV